MKALRVDFYKVTSPHDFGADLKRIWSLPNEDSRTFQFRDSPVRLRALTVVDGKICGDMVRIRLGEPAFLAKKHGGERPITQDEDEGLGETNAFIYCPQSKYIAFQRNRTGVSATGMSYYVQQLNNRREAFQFEPVLVDVKVNELVGMAAHKRLRLKVKAATLDANSTQNAALDDLIDAAHKMESAEMEITFSMGRSRNQRGMNKQGVIGFVKTALKLRNDGHEVKALEVSAVDQESHRAELFDFVDATLKSIQFIEPSPLVDEFFRRRLECVQAAWGEHNSKLV